MLLGPFLAGVCVLILVREEKFSIGPERSFLFAIEIELFRLTVFGSIDNFYSSFLLLILIFFEKQIFIENCRYKDLKFFISFLYSNGSKERKELSSDGEMCGVERRLGRTFALEIR